MDWTRTRCPVMKTRRLTHLSCGDKYTWLAATVSRPCLLLANRSGAKRQAENTGLDVSNSRVWPSVPQPAAHPNLLNTRDGTPQNIIPRKGGGRVRNYTSPYKNGRIWKQHLLDKIFDAELAYVLRILITKTRYFLFLNINLENAITIIRSTPESCGGAPVANHWSHETQWLRLRVYKQFHWYHGRSRSRVVHIRLRKQEVPSSWARRPAILTEVFVVFLSACF